MRKLFVLLIILSGVFAQEITLYPFAGQVIVSGRWDNYGYEIRLSRAAPDDAVFTAVTAVNGRFRFTALPAGVYDLHIYNGENRLFSSVLEIPAPDFFWKYSVSEADDLSFAVLNLLLTGLICGAALLLWLKRPTLKSRQILLLAASFALYTGTDFFQNVLAWRGLEGLAGGIFFLKHIGSAWFGYWFYKFWSDFGATVQTKDFYWLPPFLESLILCTWPFFGLDPAFENFWFFSFAALRLVIMLQLALFIAAGSRLVFRRKNKEKDLLFRNILTATQYVFGLLLLLLLGLVLLPLIFWHGAEYFAQQYVLTALIFGLLLFGWLVSTEIYRQMLDTQRRLEQQERLNALGALASGLAHEIKNPLAAINNLARLFPSRWREPDFRRNFQAIVPRQIDRINNLLGNLLNLTRPLSGARKYFDAVLPLKRALDLLDAQARKQGVALAREFVPGLTCRGDPRALEQVFLNLGLNALQAMPRGGTLAVRSGAASGRKTLVFRDTGGGIAPAALAKIFDPFFTTKKSGTGLGLSISKKILDEHRIKIDVFSQLKKGTEIRLLF